MSRLKVNLCFVSTLFCSCLFAQENKTEVYVIGTQHYGNPKITHKTLYRVLDQIKPNLILEEDNNNKKYKTAWGVRTVRYLKLWKYLSEEQVAIQKYYQKNRGVNVYFFDTVINKRREYLKKLKKNYPLVDQYLSTIEDKEDSLKYAEYLSVDRHFVKTYRNSTLQQINADSMVELSRMNQKLEDSLVLNLARKHITDTTLLNWYIGERQFWTDRNEAICRNIIKIIQQEPNKRIVIITGLLHKYYILDKLKQITSPNFIIKEIADMN